MGYSQWGRDESERLSYEHTAVVEEWGRGAGVCGTGKRIKWSRADFCEATFTSLLSGGKLDLMH